MAHLLSVQLPYPGPARDEYVPWIELWLRVLHQPDLLPQCEAISAQWRGYFREIVRRGTETGEFAPPADPEEAADRLMAFGDGVGFDTALGYAWTSPERMHERIVAFASEQLLARGILIRPGTELGLPGWARITVAPDAVMDRAAAALLEARAELTTTEAAAAS
jgi:hypothetical protein